MPGRASNAGRPGPLGFAVRGGRRFARRIRAARDHLPAVRQTARRRWRQASGWMRHGRGRRFRRPALIAMSLAAYGLLLPTGWAMASTGRYRASVERVPPMPVAVVFGAGLFGDQPSLCRAAGIEAWGVGDATFSAYPAPSANSYARELPAMVKAAYAAVVKPDPHFLGRRETGVREALAGR